MIILRSFGIWLLLVLVSDIHGQNEVSTAEVFQLKHTLFKSSDSSFELTRLTSQLGEVSYHRGYLTPDSIPRNGSYITYFERGGSQVRKQQVYELDNGVDTLASFYSIESYSLPSEAQYRGTWFVVDELVEDAAHTLILRDFGIGELQPEAVYHLSPFEKGRQHESDGYALYIIDDWESESIKASCMVGTYSSSGEFEVKKKESVELTKGQRKRLVKKLNEIRERDVTNCLRPGERGKVDLIYYGGHKYLLSVDCVSNIKAHRSSMLITSLLPSYLGKCCVD